MSREIESYAFFWNTEANEGQITLRLKDGGVANVMLDSPAEGSLLLDVLRNEKPVFYEEANNLLTTGLEPVGEGAEGGS